MRITLTAGIAGSSVNGIARPTTFVRAAGQRSSTGSRAYITVVQSRSNWGEIVCCISILARLRPVSTAVIALLVGCSNGSEIAPKPPHFKGTRLQ
jgi:hypothetical protein